ncbi:MAG: polysaccharide deacetylase family protein [Gaiellaceae bacterium]
MKTLLAAVLVVALVPAATAAPERPTPGLGRPTFPPAWAQHRALRQILARRQIVSCGGGHGDAVALTFDDGPSPYTMQLLQILQRNGAHATFFDVGNRLAYWPRAAYAEARLGGVGNHTWSHAHLTRLPHWLVWLQLMTTQHAVDSQVGWKPRLFRTPYAEHSRATDDISVRLGLVEVFWNVDGRDDVPHAHVGAIVRNVERGLRPGSIILLHDLHPWTVRALPKILHAIHLRGLRAMSVQELLAVDPPAAGQRCPYDSSS